ncbi:MAG: hypothetical protein R2850_11065 [Bacteroidia bacterium]
MNVEQQYQLLREQKRHLFYRPVAVFRAFRIVLFYQFNNPGQVCIASCFESPESEISLSTNGASVTFEPLVFQQAGFRPSSGLHQSWQETFQNETVGRYAASFALQ